jgi:hypothetical protein
MVRVFKVIGQGAIIHALTDLSEAQGCKILWQNIPYGRHFLIHKSNHFEKTPMHLQMN